MLPETIIAVDPALRAAGYAVLRREGKKLSCAAYGVIRSHLRKQASDCLLAIHEGVAEIIRQHEPQAMAVESVIYVQSYPTAITLGAARGAVILAAAMHRLPVHEYAPRRVKQAIVGRGGADKRQVAFMVRVLLGMLETPPADAADAIAVGIAHFHALDAARARKTNLSTI
ncbi:MAG TPA: crossover junction endodeoxyribonuclease RuvC [Terrimicrobiaceae bacterium]